MDLKLFAIVFSTVFIAELGDKTQLATLLFSSQNTASPITVFIGAALALTASTGVAVAAGSLLSNYLEPKILSYLAGSAFVLIGIRTIWSAHV